MQNCICHVFRIQIVLLLIKKERKSICFPLSHTPLSIIVYYNEQHIQEDKCVHRKTFLHDLRKIQTHADMFCLEILWAGKILNAGLFFFVAICWIVSIAKRVICQYTLTHAYKQYVAKRKIIFSNILVINSQHKLIHFFYDFATTG